MKTIYIVLIFGLIGWAFYEQSKPNPNVIIQVVGVLAFFYGMMKLMSKVSSNNKDKEEDDV
jgi:arginine exporter protein ArgO